MCADCFKYTASIRYNGMDPHLTPFAQRIYQDVVMHRYNQRLGNVCPLSASTAIRRIGFVVVPLATVILIACKRVIRLVLDCDWLLLIIVILFLAFVFLSKALLSVFITGHAIEMSNNNDVVIDNNTPIKRHKMSDTTKKSVTVDQ